MTEAEIAFIVQCETGLTWSEILRAKKDTGLLARYTMIVLMHEEGLDPYEIAAFFNIDRTTVYKALNRIQELLGEDKEFKSMYLACIKAIADREELV